MPDLANSIQPVKGEGKRGRKPQGTEPDFCNMQNMEHSTVDATQAAASHSTSMENPSQEGKMNAGAAAGVLGNAGLSAFSDPSRSSGELHRMQQGIQPREGVIEPLPAAASLPPAAHPPTNANPDSPQALFSAYTQQLVHQQLPPPLPPLEQTLSASTNVTNVESLVRRLAHPNREATASGNFFDNNEGLLELATSTSSSHAHRHLHQQASEAAALTQQQQQQQPLTQPTPSTSATGSASGTASSSLPGTATQQHMLDQQIRQHSLLLLHQVQVQQQLEDQIRQSIVERRNSRRDQQEEEGPEQKREEDLEQGEEEWSLHSLDS